MAFSSSLFFLPPLHSSSYSSLHDVLRLTPPIQFRRPRFRSPGVHGSQVECSPKPETSNGRTLVVKRKTRKTRKPRPSFYEQTTKKWSLRIDSQREKFPWQVEKEEEEEEEEEGLDGVSDDGDIKPKGGTFGVQTRVAYAPWVHGGRSKKIEREGRGGDWKHLLEQRNSMNGEKGTDFSNFVCGSNSKLALLNGAAETQKKLKQIEFGGHKGFFGQESYRSNSSVPFSHVSNKDDTIAFGKNDAFRQKDDTLSTRTSRSIGINGESENGIAQRSRSSFNQKRYDSNFNSVKDEESFILPREFIEKDKLPWKRNDSRIENKALRYVSKTQLAEKTIPEPELRRIRNAALRMKERIKVGSAGVTEALVEAIHEKWKEAEIVKMKFVGRPAIDMKKTHEILESKTSGLVIWRSGSSVVLYRGMTYNLPCVKSYSEHVNYKAKDTPFQSNEPEVVHNQAVDTKGSLKHKEKSKSLVETSHGCINTSDIDGFLDELGPRFMDWSGSKPLPVDADSLPSIVPGYKAPLRFLPFRIKTALSDKEMTYLRRLARSMHPHFALGRNRNLQGLANAMVKLWERSIISKIAIKRAVPNTCNERMAEELKVLTGGVLLSRNKEFIVFYRGNDFLTPSIAEAVAEREKLANVRQDEEEQARRKASESIKSNARLPEMRHLAGTLAETLEAKAHWADVPSVEEREQMMRDTALAKHASLIKLMEKKLHSAREKVKKAERALARVQESLDPAELPTDLETVTDEERFLYRKMGLKMRGYLSLGRRGVFDGTIQNMHLNWKHHELVKIIVKGKSFAQLKQIAISLEAESGGVLISLDKTTKGYAIVVYRGKNYQQPQILRPKNLLTKREALERSIELQRREALKYHISNLTRKLEAMKSEIELQMERKDVSDESPLNDVFCSDDDDNFEEEGEEAYLETYNMGDD